MSLFVYSDKALGAQFGVNEICCITDTTPMVEEEQAELDEELKAIKMKSTPIPPVSNTLKILFIQLY